MNVVSWVVFGVYLATIPAANWMIGNVGTQFDADGPHLIPVLPGVFAPSGVLMIGVALFLRDEVQRRLGTRWAFGAVAVGVAISWVLASPFLALASAVAFLVSETLDLLVYTPLKARGWHPAAVFASGTVGSVVDSVAFLLLAFGSLAHVEGQIIGKVLITAVAAVAVWAAERFRPVAPAVVAG